MKKYKVIRCLLPGVALFFFATFTFASSIVEIVGHKQCQESYLNRKKVTLLHDCVPPNYEVTENRQIDPIGYYQTQVQIERTDPCFNSTFSSSNDDQLIIELFDQSGQLVASKPIYYQYQNLVSVKTSKNRPVASARITSESDILFKSQKYDEKCSIQLSVKLNCVDEESKAAKLKRHYELARPLAQAEAEYALLVKLKEYQEGYAHLNKLSKITYAQQDTLPLLNAPILEIPDELLNEGHYRIETLDPDLRLLLGHLRSIKADTKEKSQNNPEFSKTESISHYLSTSQISALISLNFESDLKKTKELLQSKKNQIESLQQQLRNASHSTDNRNRDSHAQVYFEGIETPMKLSEIEVLLQDMINGRDGIVQRFEKELNLINRGSLNEYETL